MLTFDFTLRLLLPTIEFEMELLDSEMRNPLEIIGPERQWRTSTLVMCSTHCSVQAHSKAHVKRAKLHNAKDQSGSSGLAHERRIPADSSATSTKRFPIKSAVEIANLGFEQL